MALLTFISLLVLGAALCAVFYGQFSRAVREEIKATAETLRNISLEEGSTVFYSIDPADIRISVVRPDGQIIYDNAASAQELENHADREEIREALNGGFGESRRFSATLGQESWYYAVRLPDGNVLRLAKATSNAIDFLKEALPAALWVLAAVFVIGYIAAGELTKMIVEPINSASLEEGFVQPYDELAPFVRTINEQRRQIDAQIADLRERSDTVSAIMENMSEGAAMIDGKGNILSANRSALRIFDADSPMEGRNIIQLLRDATLMDYAKAALAGRRGETDTERSGRVYHVYFSPVAGSGAILLFLDTTERARAEKLRREFSANVSHELKTPLTSISGYAEMLAGGMVRDGDRDAFIRKISDETARMIALVEDIMLLSNLDEGADEKVFAHVDIACAATSAATALASKAEEAQVSIKVEGEKVFVWANSSMMSEMFFNLIDNAIKYNKPGGSVVVRFLKKRDKISAVVSDTGIGIPKSEQSRVFERFYRVDKSRSKKTGGTGLGLAIVKHIAIIHGAEIALHSCEDRGSAISVDFKSVPDKSGGSG